MRFSDFLLIVIVLTGTVSGQSLEDIQDIASGLFGAGSSVRLQTVELDTKDVASLTRENSGQHPWKKAQLYIVEQEHAIAGYCLIDNVKGKARQITYLVAFDSAGVIKGLEVMKYRESHGGEVQSAMFRDQFAGKSHRDAISIGKDIRNISGATISSRALTRGARALTSLMHFLKREGRL